MSDMDAPRFTPGPWKATTDKASWGVPGFRVMASGIEVSRSYLGEHSSTPDFDEDGIEEYPQRVDFYGGGTSYTTREDAERARANAHLIAAAPDMYAALLWAKDIVEAYLAPTDEAERAEYIEKYTALMYALHKATGKIG